MGGERDESYHCGRGRAMYNLLKCRIKNGKYHDPGQRTRAQGKAESGFRLVRDRGIEDGPKFQGGKRD